MSKKKKKNQQKKELVIPPVDCFGVSYKSNSKKEQEKQPLKVIL